jgi:IS605 OrfB family transposase
VVTLHCKITFDSEKDREQLRELMRRFSSCYRYAYNRLLEGKDRKELKKHLQKVFNLNSRYCDDAIFKAQSLIKLCVEKGKNPEKVTFGGRKLFEKLKKKHINGEEREKLKRKWDERRKGFLYSRGDKAKKGNLNTRIEFEKEKLILRINTGDRIWIRANIKRTVTRQKDRWINFTADLIRAERTKEYFPYSVELRTINGEFYAFISHEAKISEPEITKERGTIGIDVNASPFHIAMAFVKPDGNLSGTDRISLHYLINKTKNQREYLIWQTAHQVVNIARRENKAIAIERLKDLPKGERGDGSKKLRKRLQRWTYRGLLEKIKILARRNGIEVIEVSPAYTSVIGMLKYAPQYSMDKDTAGAFVTGRKALGFKEKLPENYEKLITDKEYLNFAVERLTEEKQKERERLKQEKNRYKRKPIKKNIRELNKYIKLIQSLYSEPQSQQPVNLWKEQVRDLRLWAGYKLWQVVKAALAFPALGKSLSRDLSPLKSLLVTGDWGRIASKARSCFLGQGLWYGQIPPVGESIPEKAETNTPTQSVLSFIHFG